MWRCVIHAIWWAYNVAGKASLDCRAHDVRKIAASLWALTGKKLQDVLTLGNWSSLYTFFKHYFVLLDCPESADVQHQCVPGCSLSFFSFQDLPSSTAIPSRSTLRTFSAPSSSSANWWCALPIIYYWAARSYRVTFGCCRLVPKALKFKVGIFLALLGLESICSNRDAIFVIIYCSSMFLLTIFSNSFRNFIFRGFLKLTIVFYVTFPLKSSSSILTVYFVLISSHFMMY